MIRARFAPSPTGDLHVGSASTALASFVVGTRLGGKNVLRIEDIDTPRVVAKSAERQLEDLAWLGLTWDEGPERGGPHSPYVQSARNCMYSASIESLDRLGLVYPCDCSRAEILARNAASANVSEASAPHGEELVYPGTCRDLPKNRELKRTPALRLRVPEGARARVTFDDGVFGPIEEDVTKRCGDFVLQRGDGLFAYHLAVSVDDLAMEITDVVRGADLLSSTSRQILLMKLLGAERVPRYTHVPLVLAKDGARLAKRDRRALVRELREDGVSADALLGLLAFGLGLSSDSSPKSAKQIAESAPANSASAAKFSREPFRYDGDYLFRSAK